MFRKARAASPSIVFFVGVHPVNAMTSEDMNVERLLGG